ncbi:hypothetical protein ACN6LA_001200 [Streptomyces sp. SAS_269]|uniref:hypothetical protein n=1 Tax=Streptomyces sp. SAS_269 TaxID=3412749 RepID=UPI00403D46FA
MLVSDRRTRDRLPHTVPPRQRASIVVQYTDLLRTSDYDLWSRLRELLKGQGLDPDRTIVVDLLREGPDHEDG